MSFDHTILKGTTSKIIEVILRDSSTGAGKTAVASTDVTASFVREGGTRTAITLASGSAGDAYSSGKWCEVDATNCPGLYQLHLPNAALSTGVNAVTTTLTATGVIDKVVRISLLDVDLRDAADAGLSNLDAAISSRSTVAASDIVSGGAITTSGGAVSNVTLVATTTTNTDMVDVSGLSTFDPSTDQVTASNMRGTDNAFLAASAPANFGSLGINASGHVARVALVDTTTTNSDMRGTDSANTVAPDNSSISAIKAKTDQMVFTVSGQIDANALTGGGGATAAEVYTYFVTGSNADALKADVSSLASQASVDTVDGVVDAIKLKTDQLTFTTPNSVDATATANVDEAAIANAVLAGIGGNDVTISSPLASDGTTITIVRGDDYNASDTRAITWTGDSDDQWPSLSGATLKFTASNKMDSMTITPTVTQPTGSQAFRMELTKDDTEIMSRRYKYDVQATLSSGRVITLVVGEMIVKQTYTDRP